MDVKRYKIIVAAQVSVLEDGVNRAMEEGYMPCGGICEAVNGRLFLQPMILYPVYSARRHEGSVVTWAALTDAMLRTNDVGADNGND